MFKLNEKTIRLDQDLVIGEGDEAITIPAASLQDAATREQYGIVHVADGLRPDDRFYWVEENGDGTFNASPKDVDTLRSVKAAEIAMSRFRLEIGGVTLPGGVKINTERDSQAMISGALLRVQRSPSALIDWKGGDGWVQIDKATVEAIADAVSGHVQACFTAERAKFEELHELTDPEDIIAFDTTVTLP